MDLLKILINDVKNLRAQNEVLNARVLSIEAKTGKIDKKDETKTLNAESPYIKKMFKLIWQGYIWVEKGQPYYIYVPTEQKNKLFLVFYHSVSGGFTFWSSNYPATWDIVGSNYRVHITAGEVYGYFKLYECNFDFGTLR